MGQLDIISRILYLKTQKLTLQIKNEIQKLQQRLK